ncbi:MAG: hypothetical protein Kow0068_25160 [Marinilabiliales bacterium]
MKFLFYCVIALFVFSCSDNTNKNKIKTKPVQLNKENKHDSLKLINTLDKKWIKIIKTDSGYFRLKSCDETIKSTEILKIDSSYFIKLIWEYAETLHKIISIKKDNNSFVIKSLFGNKKFDFNIKLISDSISFWKWNWENSLDQKRKYFSGYFTPEKYIKIFPRITEPCYKCHEPEFCNDYFGKYINATVKDLFEDKYFVKRFQALCSTYTAELQNNIPDSFSLNLNNDSVIVIKADNNNSIIVIDVKNNLIYAGLKNDNYILKFAEKGHNNFPDIINNCFSQTN